MTRFVWVTFLLTVAMALLLSPLLQAGNNLGLLVGNASSLDAEEQAAYSFASNHGFAVTRIDPSMITNNPAILNNVDGFWADNAAPVSSFNNSTVIQPLLNAINAGKGIFISFGGGYTGQCLGLGNATSGSWCPSYPDAGYFMQALDSHPIYNGLATWNPATPPIRQEQLLYRVNPGCKTGRGITFTGTGVRNYQITRLVDAGGSTYSSTNNYWAEKTVGQGVAVTIGENGFTLGTFGQAGMTMYANALNYICSGGSQTPTGKKILVYSTRGYGTALRGTDFDTDLPAVLAQDGFGVTVRDRASFTAIDATTLSSYDQLWFVSTEGSNVLSGTEVQAIQDFHNAGKGIMVISDGCSYNKPANQFSSGFGAQFVSNTCCDCNHCGGAIGCMISTSGFPAHEIWSGVTQIQANLNEGNLAVTGSAQIIASQNGINMVAATTGSGGRVAWDATVYRFSDATAHPNLAITYGDNARYVRNLANWLAGSGQPLSVSVVLQPIRSGSLFNRYRVTLQSQQALTLQSCTMKINNTDVSSECERLDNLSVISPIFAPASNSSNLTVTAEVLASNGQTYLASAQVVISDAAKQVLDVARQVGSSYQEIPWDIVGDFIKDKLGFDPGSVSHEVDALMVADKWYSGDFEGGMKAGVQAALTYFLEEGLDLKPDPLTLVNLDAKVIMGGVVIITGTNAMQDVLTPDQYARFSSEPGLLQVIEAQAIGAAYIEDWVVSNKIKYPDDGVVWDQDFQSPPPEETDPDYADYVVWETVNDDYNTGWSNLQNVSDGINTWLQQLSDDFSIFSFSPVDISITDELGETTSPAKSEIPRSGYFVNKSGKPGEWDACCFVYKPSQDKYVVRAVPKSNATPDSSFTLVAAFSGGLDTLAFHSRIADISSQGYIVFVKPYAFLSGFVHKDSTVGLLGVPLDIYDVSSNLWKSVVTDDSGYYHVDSIPNGNYSITIHPSLGYESDSLTKHFTVNHVPVTINFTLTKVAEVAKAQLLPTLWYSSWTGSSAGTVRGYVGGIPDGHTVNDIVPMSIKLNGSVPIFGGTYRIRPSMTGFTGSVMEIAFSRQLAVQSLPQPWSNGNHTILITGDFTDGNKFVAAVDITLSGAIAKEVAGEDESATETANVPVDFSLGDAHPNPFNPSTTIEFGLPAAGQVKLEVFNTLGQKVRTLIDAYITAGTHSIEWNSADDSGNRVASGIYLYRIQAGDFSETKKMVLMK